MNAIAGSTLETSTTGNISNHHAPKISFEHESDTLVLNDVEIRLDFQLEDDDLAVSLLVESLEQQYQEMVSHGGGNACLNLQSAKEWVSGNRNKLSGLFRYLKSL